MAAQIIKLDGRRGCISQSPPNPLVDALDALGLALASHMHVWTDREKTLYELALTYLGKRL